jgi:AcrR family transcriptional regulator
MRQQSTKKSVEPPASRSEQQQRYIAGVVYDLIGEVGIENLTMRQIAEAAKVSLGTITYHFPNKRALIAMAMDAGYALPEDWSEYAGSPTAQLARIALSYAPESPKSRWWRFWINHLAMSSRDPELQASQARRFDRQRRFWIKLLTAGIEHGEIRSDIDIERTVDEMLVVAHGLITLQFVKPTPKMRAYAREKILAMIVALRSTSGA